MSEAASDTSLLDEFDMGEAFNPSTKATSDTDWGANSGDCSGDSSGNSLDTTGALPTGSKEKLFAENTSEKTITIGNHP